MVTRASTACCPSRCSRREACRPSRDTNAASLARHGIPRESGLQGLTAGIPGGAEERYVAFIERLACRRTAGPRLVQPPPARGTSSRSVGWRGSMKPGKGADFLSGSTPVSRRANGRCTAASLIGRLESGQPSVPEHHRTRAGSAKAPEMAAHAGAEKPTLLATWSRALANAPANTKLVKSGSASLWLELHPGEAGARVSSRA